MYYGKIIMDAVEEQERIALIADGCRVSQEEAERKWERMQAKGEVAVDKQSVI
jgi:hypothetical protein